VCGGVTLKDYQGTRKFCGNPEWWQPLEKAAKKEERANAKKSKKGSGAKKSSGSKSAFFVPSDVAVLKGDEWSTPKGYTRLVDSYGAWVIVNSHKPADGFDPRGLQFPSSALAVLGRLLLVKESHAVVKSAREAWVKKWADRLVVLEREFAAQLEKGVRGVATPAVAVDTLVAFVQAADGYPLRAMCEMAEILGLDIAPLLKAAEKSYGWGDERHEKRAKALGEAVRKMKPKDAATLLAAIVTAAHKELSVPSSVLRAEQQAVVSQILKSKHPWASKSAAKAAPAADDDAGDEEYDDEEGDE
jgi:hypothetical protein